MLTTCGQSAAVRAGSVPVCCNGDVDRLLSRLADATLGCRVMSITFFSCLVTRLQQRQPWVPSYCCILLITKVLLQRLVLPLWLKLWLMFFIV
jgi:hypothetical protein